MSMLHLIKTFLQYSNIEENEIIILCKNKNFDNELLKLIRDNYFISI